MEVLICLLLALIVGFVLGTVVCGVCFVESARREGYARGLQTGTAQGRRAGLEQGIQEGHVKGYAAALTTVTKLAGTGETFALEGESYVVFAMKWKGA